MQVKFIVLIIFSCFLLTAAKREDKSQNYIERTRSYYKPFYEEISPVKTAGSWKVPFETSDRGKMGTIKIISVFGDHRNTFLKGHIHTGADIIPAKNTDNYTYVYPAANGVICSVHLDHPHKTIVIKHLLADSNVIFTSYKHLQEVYVKTGMQVDTDTRLARLYTRAEAKRRGGSFDHLHFEVRKSFYDYGCASWLTMTKEELNKYFYDPAEFIRKNIRNK